jgi:hypothetical protein
MRQANFEQMLNKMCGHFRAWSNRSLTLLGKIQIIKTFGISQYLYPLAVMDLEPEHWKTVRKEISRFLWNKSYATQTNTAPHRIKKEVMYTSVAKGGFGMVDMADIMAAARLKRFTYLQMTDKHPMARLQLALGAGSHLRKRAILNIDDVTSGVITLLHKHQLKVNQMLTVAQIESDLLLHRQVSGSSIRDLVRDGMANSIEMASLRLAGIRVVSDLWNGNINYMDTLCRVAEPALVRTLRTLRRIYGAGVLPEIDRNIYLYSEPLARWNRVELMSSRQIRLTLTNEICLTETKLIRLQADTAAVLYKKIAKLRNTANKAKLLRLIHGDVYCAARTYRFGLTDSDRCIRCFGEETIKHLLLECPYTQEVWGRLGIFPTNVAQVLDSQLTVSELEVRAELIGALVFRKKVLPPEVLIYTVFKSFQNGLSRNTRTTNYAADMVDRYEITRQWYT